MFQMKAKRTWNSAKEIQHFHDAARNLKQIRRDERLIKW